mmetsp:Transcript_9257/g.28871  ORF Transcript_9257/g.28871 Transcript_9257/m.28871 type:complete len:284 (-) Transcript_9257:3-854(-)
MKPSMQKGSTAHQVVGLPGASVVMTCRSREPSPAESKVSLIPLWPSGPSRPTGAACAARPKACCSSRTSPWRKASSLNSPTACVATGPPPPPARGATRLPGGTPRSCCNSESVCGARGSTKSTGLACGLMPASLWQRRPRRASLPEPARQLQPAARGSEPVSTAATASTPESPSSFRQTAMLSTGRKLARPKISAALSSPCATKSARRKVCVRKTLSCRNVSSRLPQGFAMPSLYTSSRPSLFAIAPKPRDGAAAELRGCARRSGSSTAGGGAGRRPAARRLR